MKVVDRVYKESRAKRIIAKSYCWRPTLTSSVSWDVKTWGNINDCGMKQTETEFYRKCYFAKLCFIRVCISTTRCQLDSKGQPTNSSWKLLTCQAICPFLISLAVFPRFWAAKLSLRGGYWCSLWNQQTAKLLYFNYTSTFEDIRLHKNLNQ